MKSLVFGSLNIDIIYRMNHIVTPGETEASASVQKNAGGKGLNQAVALARAGAETYMAGCIGSDGGFLSEMLAQYGVNTDNVVRKEIPNGNAVIQVDANGQNAIILFGGSNQSVTEEQIDETFPRFSPGDLVLLQNEISCGCSVLTKAHAAGFKVAVNPSPITEDLLRWPLELADYLIVNELEGAALAGTGNVREMISVFREKYPRTNVVLTLGENGAYSIGEHFEKFEPARRVPVVDTTAAGDTFTGYYLNSISGGETPEQALAIAAMAASIAIGTRGAACSIPARDQVLARLSR